MKRIRALPALWLVLAACGGETTGADRTGSPSGGAGVGGTTGRGGGAGDAAGAGGSGPYVVDASDASTECDFAHEACGGIAAYVEIGGGSPVRLAYPADPGCGVCRNGTCELASLANESCGTIVVRLSACAKPDGAPPCLDTVHVPGRYADPTGTSWSSASLTTMDTGVSTDPSGVLDFDGTLSLTADGGTVELPAHVHVCARVVALRPPCR